MTRRNGLSLVELTITMLVIGIFAAVGSLKYAEALSEHRAKALADTVRETLLAAKHGAQTRSTPVTVTFLKNMGTYTITGLPNPTHPSKPYVVDMTAVAPAAKASENYTVAFNGFGYPATNVVMELKTKSGKKRYVHVLTSGEIKVSLLP